MIRSNPAPVRQTIRSTRKGGIMIIMPAIIILLLVVVGFAVDVGFVYSARSRLQSAADAAALAAALELRQGNNVDRMRTSSTDFAMVNEESHGEVLKDADITTGHWDEATRAFTSGGDQLNAVRVTARRNGTDNERVPSFFMKVFGVGDDVIERTAIAKFDYISTYAGFLFDDDMLHPELPEIIAQAATLGVSPESLSTDQDGKGFIDAPAGTILNLPTGNGGMAGFLSARVSSHFKKTTGTA
ncbi:MAG TPA: hypothetical protein EYG03_05085 [Planctomycetes bacterium]|nr:hypothetical protein [Planctomycetota bacterium]